MFSFLSKHFSRQIVQREGNRIAQNKKIFTTVEKAQNAQKLLSVLENMTKQTELCNIFAPETTCTAQKKLCLTKKKNRSLVTWNGSAMYTYVRN